MNKRLHFIYLLLGGMMLAGVTACSSSDDEPSKADDGVKVRRLTITETDNGTAGARQVLTRASLTAGDGLAASWTAGDGLTYCNLSNDNPLTGDIYSGSLTAASTAATSQFTGDVACVKGDYLAVVYPATTFETNDSYTISLIGQDGTLDGLASTYHYVYGRAYVESVTNTTANATMPKMKSLLTVCKFSFVNKDGGAIIPIQTLSIGYGGVGSDAGKYPQSATVAISDNMEPSAVHATRNTGSSAPLTVTANGQTEVYVALLPTDGERTYQFTVTNSSGTYTGTAKAWLKEGEYVVATGLKLTKQ
jgi:hypothetical protein